ncbi:hypothetical protein ACIGBH_41920 [Streptomyces sp. NPDC085929]|uniref:hypothetical protein n=1 Tax=Streptomyces sp. NPDC085929 TaxID=3365739 RepID=UPI0037D97C7C
MLKWADQTGCGRRALTTVAAAGAIGLLGAAPASADHRAVVNCKHNGSALRTAIAGASFGETLRVKGTCVGPFTISRDLTLIGVEGAALDGNYAGSTVEVTAKVRVRLTSLTVRNGTGSVFNGQVFGGGILNDAGGAVTLNHTTVRNNAAVFGGGIANVGPAGGTVTLVDSTVRNNTANAAGGGIYLGRDDSLTLSGSKVQDNHSAFGGGITADAGSVVTLYDSAVRGNSATNQGGGIKEFSGTVTLIHSKVERNRAGDGPGSGGGIHNVGGTVTLTDSKVRDNHPDNCAPPGAVADCTG